MSGNGEFIEFKIRIHESDCPNLFRLLRSKPSAITRNASLRMVGEIGANLLLDQEEEKAARGSPAASPTPSSAANDALNDVDVEGLVASMGFASFSDP